MRKTGTASGWAVAACMGGLAWSALAVGCGPDAEPGPPVEAEAGGVVAERDVVAEGDGVPGRAAGPEGEGRDAGAVGPETGSAPPEDSASASQGPTGETGGAGVADSASAEGDESPATTVRVLPGSRLAATADWEVSAQRNRAGDPVSATVAEDFAPAGGPVLIPRGTRLLGRVKVAEAAQGPGETAFLEIGFETLSASDYERPVETLVVETTPAPGQAVAQPGTIAEGALLVVEIRRALRLPPPLPAQAAPGSPRASDPSPRSSR